MEKWATSHAPHPKRKHVTSNASESLNSWMKDVRDISHLGLHVGMVQKCTLLLYERRGMYAAVNTQFPRATTIELEGIRTHGRTLHVIWLTDTLFAVNNYAVDTSGLVTTCQCGETKQTGMPCIHMAAVEDDIRSIVHVSFRTSSLRMVYAGIVPPVTTHDLEPVAPPIPVEVIALPPGAPPQPQLLQRAGPAVGRRERGVRVGPRRAPGQEGEQPVDGGQLVAPPPRRRGRQPGTARPLRARAGTAHPAAAALED